jgi:RimJ/RimL family protein N-acetyltransferase
MAAVVQLREVRESDLPVFFENQADEDASRLAAVASRDREGFEAHWARIRADDATVIRTILFDGEVAGNVLSFERDGLREVGYWISRSFWGKGIATAALAEFLEVDTTRPLHAKVAGDNHGSVRVLEKSGFVLIGARLEYDDVRGGEIEDRLYELR